LVKSQVQGVRELESLVQAHYDAAPASVRLLAGGWDGSVYLVTRPQGPAWVLRVVSRKSAERDVAVLSFLESQHFPAPRVIRSLSGCGTAPFGEHSVLVTTFIDGTPAGFFPYILFGVGEALGRLHTLNSAEAHTLPPAEMLPATDMAIALEWLALAEPRLPPGLRGWYDQLVGAIRGIRSYDHLPQSLIHNDCHPGNAILMPEGPIMIDWHGAGLGPPVVDLGFLLISCEIAPSWVAPLTPNSDRVVAIVDGYARYRTPTRDELDWLPDAMRFRSLLYGAAHIAKCVEQGLETVSETWWWERYEAADEVANRVRLRFEGY